MPFPLKYPAWSQSAVSSQSSVHDVLHDWSVKSAWINENGSIPTDMTTPSHHISGKSRLSGWSRLSLDNWTWEMGAAMLCLCIIAAISGILLGYDGRPLPDLPNGLTLNAIISILATLAKATLMVILAAALRQEKWLWFIGEPRPLSTVDAFEEASRGPFGSLMLLLSRRGSIRALAAASVTVLALGFEPFIQQLVTIQVRNVPIEPGAASVTASIRTPTSYNESVIGNLGGSSLSLNALIGAFGGAAGAIPAPVCPGGNCTWPTYNTLAMCTVCRDMNNTSKPGGDAFTNVNLTSYLEQFADTNATDTASKTWTPTYSFPHGNPVNVSVNLDLTLGSSVQWTIHYPRRVVWPLNIDPSPNSGWTLRWGDHNHNNTAYAGIPAPLFAMGYLDLDLDLDVVAERDTNGTSSTTTGNTETASSGSVSWSRADLSIRRATECAFTPCVRTMDTSVQSGQTISKITATNYGRVTVNQHDSTDGTITSGWAANINGTEYSILDRGTDNTQGHAYLLIQALRIALEGNTTYSQAGYWYTDPGLQATQGFNYSAAGFTQISSPWSSAGQQAIDGADDFATVVDGVGRALTGRFQQLQPAPVVTGTALRSQAIVVVRWAWLTYPLTLAVLGVAALSSTVVSTRRREMAVWKESTLPLLLRYNYTPNADGAAPLATIFSNTIPPPLTSGTDSDPLSHTNKVSSIVTQASCEKVQLRRRPRDSFWVLESYSLSSL